jgi:P pilus assembly chaperone PapD
MRPAAFHAWLALSCALAFCARAQASVVAANTRVVFPGDAREVTVRLSNQRAVPALVEAWIEHGDVRLDADGRETRPVPFAITPPLFRMEPGKGQALRVHRLPVALPTDRESLYWLNILDLPPNPPEAVAGNLMKMAVRSRIKLFLRPAGLPGTAFKAPERIAWRLMDDHRGVPALQLDNPTPFHVTIARVIVGDGAMDLRGEMIAPFARILLPLDAPSLEGGTADAVQRARRFREAGAVAFRFLNDSGGTVLRTARLVDGARAP